MVGPPSSEAMEAVLALVARGNAILAELSRLAEAVPALFLEARGDGAQVPGVRGQGSGVFYQVTVIRCQVFSFAGSL